MPAPSIPWILLTLLAAACTAQRGGRGGDAQRQGQQDALTLSPDAELFKSPRPFRAAPSSETFMELNVEITYSGARSGPETWRGVFRAEADTLYDCSGFTSMDDDGHGISDSGVAYEAEFGGTYPADEGKERRLSVQMRFEWGYYDIDLMPGHFQGPGSYFWRSRRDETTPVHAGATHVDRPESPVRMYGYLAGKPDYQVSTEPSGWLTAVWCGEKCTERHYCTIDVTKASLDWFEAEFQCRYEMSSPPAAVPEEAHNAGYLEYSGRIGFQPGVCPFSPP